MQLSLYFSKNVVIIEYSWIINIAYIIYYLLKYDKIYNQFPVICIVPKRNYPLKFYKKYDLDEILTLNQVFIGLITKQYIDNYKIRNLLYLVFFNKDNLQIEWGSSGFIIPKFFLYTIDGYVIPYLQLFTRKNFFWDEFKLLAKFFNLPFYTHKELLPEYLFFSLNQIDNTNLEKCDFKKNKNKYFLKKFL